VCAGAWSAGATRGWRLEEERSARRSNHLASWLACPRASRRGGRARHGSAQGTRRATRWEEQRLAERRNRSRRRRAGRCPREGTSW